MNGTRGPRGGAVGEVVVRSTRLEIERALGQLRKAERSPHSESGVTQAVHEVRKSFKKVRAALRLLRADLGDDVYQDENGCFRDAARPLAEVRDADMLVEVFDVLSRLLADQVDAACVEKMRDVLVAKRHDAFRRILDEDRALPRVAEIAERALARVPEWRIEPEPWASLLQGLRRAYRAGRRAMVRARARSRMEDLHEWRKQAKYLRHQHQILEASWSKCETDRADRLHVLSRLLGEDHDLAVLRQTLAANPSAYGGHASLKQMFAILDARRAELEEQAFELGRSLYDTSPRVFAAALAAGRAARGDHSEPAAP